MFLLGLVVLVMLFEFRVASLPSRPYFKVCVYLAVFL